MAENKDEVIAKINQMAAELDLATARIDAQDAVIEQLRKTVEDNANSIPSGVLAEINTAFANSDAAAQRHKDALDRLETDDPSLPANPNP